MPPTMPTTSRKHNMNAQKQQELSGSSDSMSSINDISITCSESPDLDIGSQDLVCPIPGCDIPERDIPERDIPERDIPERDIPERDIPEPDVPERDQGFGDIEGIIVSARHTLVIGDVLEARRPERDLPERDLPERDARERDLPEREIPDLDPELDNFRLYA